MPENIIYRKWCKTCNDFKLHTPNTIGSQSTLTCRDCETVYSDVYISDIPTDKVLQQRARYSNQRQRKFSNMFAMISSTHEFSPFIASDSIIESDAGLVEEERIRSERWEAKRKAEKEELIAYNNLGRNEICLCGSTLKYKKCCWAKHQTYK